MPFFSNDFGFGEYRNNDTESVSDEYIESEEPFVYFVLFFIPLVLVSNLIVSVSSFLMIFQRKDSKCSYVSLFNVSVSDVIICASVLLGFLEINSITDVFCAFQLGSIMSGNLSLMLSILFLALERYVYVVHGRKLDSYFTPCRIALVIIAIWALAFCIGLIPSIFDASANPGKNIEVCLVMKTPLTGVVASLIISSLACVITPIAYVGVYRRVKRTSMKMTHNCKIPKFKLKSILLVFVTSLTALICCYPYIVILAWYKFFCEPSRLRCRGIEYGLASPFAIIGFSSTLIHPLIYAWWHPPYCNTLKNVFCTVGKRARRQSLLQTEAEKDIKTIS